MRIKIFTIISMLFLGLTSAQAEEKEISISNESLANSCLTTIDINITKNLALKDDLIIDYDYRNFKTSGIIKNVYYTYSKKQRLWLDLRSRSDMVINRGFVLVPLKSWIEDGIKKNLLIPERMEQSFIIRIVLFKGGNC